MTPVKANGSQMIENTDPNLSSTPKQRSGKTPSSKSAKSIKSVQKSLNQTSSPGNRLRDRKFIVAKKKKKAQGAESISDAYHNLRASQEDFFKNKKSNGSVESEIKEVDAKVETTDGVGDADVEGNGCPSFDRYDDCGEELEEPGELGISTIKRRRNKMLEEARKSVPESGRVLHLVSAFERLLTIPKSKDKEEEEEEKDEKKKGTEWAVPLPGLRAPRVSERQESLSPFTPPSGLVFTDNFGRESRLSSSLDSSRGSHSSRTSGGGRRSRRNSLESTSTFGGSKWKKKQLRTTQQKPFKLRTEQRGRSKEEEFVKKVQEKCLEEEKLRIPVAQGLPWTTDEPECLVKPPVKEITKPIDLKLHSDMRAAERAEFDQYVSEKLSLIEQYKLERERQQKLAEEEEIKRLRKELAPRAQPMPYFDRPFVPQRSVKNPTVPKEPRFHNPHHKKIKCMSLNDINIYTHQQH